MDKVEARYSPIRNYEGVLLGPQDVAIRLTVEKIVVARDALQEASIS